MGTATRKPWTAEELDRLPKGWRYEIDEGELVIMAPAGFEHGRLQVRIGRIVGNFVAEHGLGEVAGGEMGFFVRRDPDVLRAPDVAFYSNERLTRIRDRKRFPDVPPDLAVEIHDPSEPDLNRKIRQYLEGGVRAVWVVYPETGTLARHAPGEEPRVWSAPEAVVEEPILPGFACRLAELFGEK